MFRKIGMLLDRAKWSVTVFGNILIFAGLYCALVQNSGWGLVFFLLGLFVVAPYAAKRRGVPNRKLSKDVKGTLLVFFWAVCIVFTAVAILIPNTLYMLGVPIAFFIISIGFEAYSDWTVPTNASG